MPAETPARNPRVAEKLAEEFPRQAAFMPAILGFLDADVPVPFVTRFRREKTGGADEERLLAIRDRHRKLRAIETGRSEAVTLLSEAGRLSEEMRAAIDRATSLTEISDLTCSQRPDLRGPEDVAAEEQFGALASAILAGDAGLPPEELAAPFVSEERGVADVEAAIAGAVKVLALRFFEDPAARTGLRAQFRSAGKLRSVLRPEADPQKKYEAYHDFRHSVSKVPSHRILAVSRGMREKALDLSVELDRESSIARLAEMLLPKDGHPNLELLQRAVQVSFDEFFATRMAGEVLAEVKKRADEETTRIFARNLRQLLSLPPAGESVVMGVDPGVRRGCKIAVVDGEGVAQRHASIQPFADPEKSDNAKKAGKTVGDFCRQFGVGYIAIGSGPGSKEAERFFRGLLKEDEGLTATVVMVNDAGTSAYASGPVGKAELPKLDTRVRAAVSLARRLKDPLREMSKVRPSSIGVGPYQREVDKRRLSRALDEVVESCVARVGADLNRDAEHILRRVPAVGAKRAGAIVARRTEKGPFASRSDLLEVEGFDEARLSLCAGFLRIADAENPLERLPLHPESHPIVASMADKLGLEPHELVGNDKALSGLDPQGFAGEDADLNRVLDVFERLRKGATDPRGVFEPPTFREDLNVLADLNAGMVLDGVITNIASFGAFVDVGIDQEGLIHVSELSDEFVEDAGAVVSVGERVKVRVLAVDAERKRLSLSRRTPGARRPSKGGGRRDGKKPPSRDGRQKDGGKGRPAGKSDRRGKDRKGRGERPDRRGPRKPMVHEQKAARAPEPEIDPELPEDERYRLKLERLRKKFETGR